jgi:solute carrier family 35 (adenosine 3'-phospho 5'-phosphosulfate transporter), member B2
MGIPETIAKVMCCAPFNEPNTIRIIGCVIGVVGSLLVYGVLQERIMSQPYTDGTKDEFFSYSVFLVLSNRCLGCLMAAGILISTGGNAKPVAGIHKYALVSLSNVVATTCQYEALKYLSFPVQTLGKCAKMIPVMIWGYLINQKRYGMADVGVALAVTAGCTIFGLYGDDSTLMSNAAKGDTATNTEYGIALMLGYLFFDGFTSTFQDKLFVGYQMETYNQMLWVNFCSSIISCCYLWSDGSFTEATSFISRHPTISADIFTLSVAAMLGQLCILYTIKEFGALLFATIMTTRQFLSILLSCIIFMHMLSWEQWGGTVLVFGALYYKSFAKGDSSSHAKKGEETEPLIKGDSSSKA